MNIIIDGKNCECERGEFLRDVAFRNDIFIPGLCHHDGLAGASCCRVCIVEMAESGRRKIVSSCVYPIEDICVVFTNSEKVQEQRAMILAFLAKSAPESEEVANLARVYNAPGLPRLKAAKEGRCILCGACVNACGKLGAGAISAINRGIDKKIATPYDEANPDCIGCGSCAAVCPVKAIPLSEEKGVRSIWNKDFTLRYCTECGEEAGTAEEASFAALKAGIPEDTLCGKCRQKKMAGQIARTYGLRTED